MIYVIKANKRAFQDTKNISFYECVLTNDAKLNIASYCIASNQVLKFTSPQDAVNYFKLNDITNRDLGTDGMPWIEGPRGGKYSIFSGERIR